ncbi:MAG TPA: hypothetical protein VJM51_01575 [Dehalococcoidia bacterium]|nr:hypothetical protein [Dehalococcoidia bacterium]HLC29456.1 hypothetical protein [Dehalococcoidia bacterium]
MKRTSRKGLTDENTYEEETVGLDSIELSLGAKGEYRWTIKVYGAADTVPGYEMMCARVEDIDARLRRQFPSPDKA